MYLRNLSFSPKEIVRSDFAAEWVGVAVLAFGAAVWAHAVKFELAMHWQDASVSCGIILAVTLAHALNSPRASLVAEYLLLTVTATLVFGVISYLSMTTGRPLVDTALMAADRAIGFDWLIPFHWLLRHAAAARVLQFAYNSLVYQGLYFGVLFGVMGKRQELREMFWLVAVAGLFTCAGAMLFPAYGPYKAFGVKVDFLPIMEQLRGGKLQFSLSNLAGVVSFPSFHTAMALLYVYGFRHAGPIGWMITALNILMLPAIPFFGGHYVVDMLAGGAVALASIVIVKITPVAVSATGQGPELASPGLFDKLFEGSADQIGRQIQ